MSNEFIPVITKQYCQKVNVEDILYLEQCQRRLTIVTEDATLVYYERLENIEHRLDRRFYHTLKKLVVNMDKIILAKDQTIYFENGTTLPLSRESYIRTKQTYMAYIKNLL